MIKLIRFLKWFYYLWYEHFIYCKEMKYQQDKSFKQRLNNALKTRKYYKENNLDWYGKAKEIHKEQKNKLF